MEDRHMDNERRQLLRLARMAECIALGGAVVVGAFAAYALRTPEAVAAFLGKDIPGATVPAGVWGLAASYAVGIVPVAIFVLAMLEARQLFRTLGAGTLYGEAVARHLVRLGWLALASALTGVIVRTLAGLLLTAGNPGGKRQLIVAIGSNEIASIIAGLLFLAFALIARQAQRLEDDSRSIV